MSTQANAGIPLSHAPDGVGYKLLELPPELVQLLESDNPPTLTLHPSPTAALLKTTINGSPKTYSLRQKNTSNGLILLSPLSQLPQNTPSARPPQPGAQPGAQPAQHPQTNNKNTTYYDKLPKADEMDIEHEQNQGQEVGMGTGTGVVGETMVAGLRTLTTLHETIELVPEAEDASAPAVKARGKWHEKFARGR